MRARRLRAGLAVATAVAFGSAAAGCSAISGHDLTLRVPAGPVAFDAPLDLTVGRADANDPVRITATASDAQQTRWTASADFTPNRAGTVDVRSAAAENGSYQGAHGAGLVWSLSAGERHPQFVLGDDATVTVTFTATQPGATAASAQQRRWYRAAGVGVHPLQRSKVGFVGTLYSPPGAGASTAAVMYLGGSEGGLPSTGPQALASRGHPVLSVAYFGAPGVPSELVDIPLEYFATALRWLARQPGVDPARITVMGGSRGSEAALLLGVHYPALVHSVAALVPSSVVNLGSLDPVRPAWTWHGRPLPHIDLREWGQTAPRDPRAVIPVERIRGPVFLLCGDQDQLWPSCTYTDAMVRRLGTHPHTVLREAAAGHLVGFLVPNLPEGSNTVTYQGKSETFGGTVQDDALGRIDAWPKLLAFLAT